MIDVHRHRDVFDPDVVLRGHGELARDAGRVLVGNGDAEPRLRDGPLELLPEVRPGGGETDCGRRVDETAAEFVVVVDVVGRDRRLPVRVGRVHFFGGAQENLLHVTPAEVRVGLEHQGHHSRRRRRGGRRSAELAVIVAGNIAGRSGAVRRRFAQSGTRSAGRRGDDEVGPGFAVESLTRAAVECPDGDRVDRIGVAVVVGVVVDLEAVAPGPQENGSFAAPARLGGVLQRGFGQWSGAFENVPRVVRAPAVAFDLNQLREVIHRLGFVLIIHESGDETQADDGRLRCGTGDTDAIVAARRRIPGARRPVIIPCPGIRIIRRGVIPIIVVGRVDIAGKVRMRRLHAVVHDTDAHTAAAAAGPGGRIGPDRLDVEIRSRERTGLVVELQVPLLVDQRIVGHRSFGVLAPQLRFGHDYSLNGSQLLGGSQRRKPRAGLQNGKARGIRRKFEGSRADRPGQLFRAGVFGELNGNERRNDPAREFVALHAVFVKHRLRGFAGSGRCDDDLLEFLRRGRIHRDHAPLSIRISDPDLVQGEDEAARNTGVLQHVVGVRLFAAGDGILDAGLARRLVHRPGRTRPHGSACARWADVPGRNGGGVGRRARWGGVVRCASVGGGGTSRE